MLALEVLRDPSYRRYWLALALSQLGGWMQNAALAWLAITLTGSAERLGLVIAFLMLPSLFFSLPAGVLADRFPRRRLVLISQSSMMLLALGMGFVIMLGLTNYSILLLFALLFGTANSVDIPARQAFTVELAGRERYAGAISLNSFSFNFSRLAGPAIAGLVIAWLGIDWTFLINGLTFGPLLFVLATGQAKAAAEERGGRLFSQAMEGVRYVFTTPMVRTVVLFVAWVGVFALNFQTLVPSYARLILHLEAQGYGLLLSALGVGAIFGALWQAAAGEARPKRVLLGGGLVSLDLLLLGLPFPAWAVGLVLTIGGFGMITMLIGANTIVQTVVPDRLRGRVMSVYALVLLGSGPLGSYLTGFTFQYLGGAWAVVLLGCLSLVGVLYFARKAIWPSSLEMSG